MTAKKVSENRPLKSTKNDIDGQVSKLLEKLIEQEPKLKATLSGVIGNNDEPSDIANQTLQIYRQKLRE